MFEININKLIRMQIFLIYRIVYEVVYHHVVSDVFGYAGLKYNPNITKMIISYGIFIAFIFISRDYSKVSGFLLDIHFIFTIIPLLAMYWQSDRSTSYILACSVCYFILNTVCYTKNVKKTKIITLGNFFSKFNITKYLMVATILILIILTSIYGIATNIAFDMASVYSLRASQSFPGILGYLINWLPYSIVPCLLCITLYKKNYIGSVLSILCQTYLYLLTGSKTTFFSIGLILFSYWLVKCKKNFVLWWCIALTVLNIVTPIIYNKFGQLMPLAIFPVRLLTLPADISNLHFEFFSNHSKLLFSENFIGRIFGIKSPYNMLASFIIGGTNSNANTGYLGDAFDNAGIPLMLIYSVILGLILRYIDKIYHTVKEVSGEGILPVFVGILTYNMIYLNDGSLTAVLITGGLLINIFVLMQMFKMEHR